MKLHVWVILYIFHGTQHLASLIDAASYVRYTAVRFLDVLQTLQTASKIHCCSICDITPDCLSVNYQNSTGICELATLPLAAVATDAQPDSEWMLFSNNEWSLAFKGCSGNGDDVYTSFVDGTNVVTNDVNCINGNVKACSQDNQHFRSQILDSWQDAGITLVKYVMYKDDIEVAYAMFNGSGSNVTNWFSWPRLMETSWTGIWSIDISMVSLEGFKPSRRFFIVEFNKCDGDRAFSLGVISNRRSCAFDSHQFYPTYMYSTAPSGGYPQTMAEMIRNLILVATLMMVATRSQ